MGRAKTTRAVAGALLLVGLTVALGAGCREERPLVGVEGRLRLSEETVAFPATYVGLTAQMKTARVSNAGRASLDIVWSQVEEPFKVEGLPERLGASAEAEVRIRFAPTEAGPFTATLTGTSPNGGAVALTLTGEGLAIPTCPTPVSCHSSAFDPQKGRCVEAPLADGTECDPGNECLMEATCTAGVCKGRERACDDGNACTTDVCNPLDGCGAVPAPPCPGDGVCQLGVCDPATGCGLAPAPDGSFCGPRRGCDLADVCVDGACVARDLPDNFVCARATPCQAEGRCKGPVCERPAPTVLSPDWTYDAKAAGRELHDMMVWSDGTLTLTGFFENPLLNAAGATPLEARDTARRCMLWNDRLLCMDLPQQGKVTLLEKATGGVRWTFTLAEERGDIAEQTSTLFMARLAVMAPDRLAALFEAYPANPDNSMLCRLYFLVVLNAKGGMVSATQLTDPLLAECNHPHPFGLASDTRGNLYVAFSQTVNSGAPLVPGAPTLVLAYSPDGVELWRRTLPMNGGELGTVRGLLLPENSSAALRVQDGSEVGTLPVLGRAVATRELVVPSPAGTSVNADADPVISTQLHGFTVPGLTQVWTHQLRPGQSFTTKELRLADTEADATGPAETLVLTFVADGTTPVLLGVRMSDGSEAYRCPLNYTPRTQPQLFELGPESLVMMDGANTCGECDPPFADSSSRFQRFKLPGTQPARASWPGTFGGPGHGHHENDLRSAP